MTVHSPWAHAVSATRSVLTAGMLDVDGSVRELVLIGGAERRVQAVQMHSARRTKTDTIDRGSLGSEPTQCFFSHPEGTLRSAGAPPSSERSRTSSSSSSAASASPNAISSPVRCRSSRWGAKAGFPAVAGSTCPAPSDPGLVKLPIHVPSKLPRHPVDRFELLSACREDRLGRAEVLQQRALARRPDAG